MPGASSVTNGGGATKRRISEPVHTKGSGSGGFSNSFSGAGSAASSSRANGTNGGTGGGTGSQISPGTVMKMKADAFEKNREKFMNTFDKPTQIYRFLRARMLESPVFLQRNLSYMQARMSRSHKSRDGFKVDNMLGVREREQEKCKRLVSPRGSIGMFNSKGSAAVNFFNIFVTGVSDGQIWLPDTKARVDIFIARLCLSKRKEGLGNSSKIFEKFVDVKMFSPVSPTSSHEIVIPLPPKCPVVSVPAADCTNGTNGHTVLSYNLVMRVSVPRACLQQVKSEQQSSNHLNSRNNNNNNSDNLEEPKAKRRRSAPTTKDRENFIYEGDACKGSSGGAGSVGGDPSQDLVVYTGYVSLYEKDIPGDKIRDMDYEITLQRAKRGAMKKVSLQRIRRGVTWESLDEKHNKVLEQAKPAGKCAKICISIRTAAEIPSTPFVTPPLPLMSKDIKNEDGALNDMSLAKQEMRKSVRIIYHFMHENFSQQQTESRDDLRCSWCSLNCMELYSLLKHFKLCHARFMFTYTAIPNGAKIDVSINESYDASYSGSAYDLVAQPPGEAFARNGPTKRTEVFSILVCRPKPVKQSLQEFFDCDEKDVDQRRTYITGHNRLYHHTSTCLPIHPREIDVDSEGEPDPEWLRVKTTMMIDEFTDVNEGEKELMKLWNLHVMKYNYVGDCQIPLACKRFVELHGRELIQKNLYRNFCLHLTNLSDFGLLTPHGIHSTIQLLHSQMKDASPHSAPLMILGAGAMDTSKSSQRNSNSQVKNGGINGVDVKPNHCFAILNASNKSGATTSKTVSSTNTATFNSTSNATANTASAATALLNSSRKVEVKLAKLGSQAGSRNGNSANK